MALVLDAVSATNFNHVTYFSRNRIHDKSLEEIFLDLDDNEIISIIFLMTNNSTDISAVINSLKEDSKSRFFEITKEKDWGEKLLEALITIENINVIKRLGFTAEEIYAMKSRYLYNIHNVSPNLNRVVKSLYFLCKELTDTQVKKLINEVYKDLQEPVLQLNEEKQLLEIYILDLIRKKYISIDTVNPKLKKFINILKINGLLPLIFDFESWNQLKKNQQDSSQVTEQSLEFVNGNNIVTMTNCNNFPWKNKEHKRLCIIVNQVDFTNKEKYATREGSDTDSKSISTTFKGMGFKILQKKNLTAAGMIELLNSLNEKPYDEYAAIFLFILSHGKDGEVIFCDDKFVTVDKIQRKVCCQKLQNTFKFIILQTCQGNKLGLIDKNLQFDSPLELENNRHLPADTSCIFRRHFGLFQATVNEYVSLRHNTEGSWFIQDACDELRKTTPITVTEWTTNVKKRVNARKVKTSENKYFVQVPCLKESTIYEEYEFPKYNDNP